MKVKIRSARLSFPDLFEATQYQGKGPFSYSATFLGADNADARVSLDEGKTWLPFKAGIDKAIQQIATEGWGKAAKANLLASEGNANKCCFMDGNKKVYDGYADKWALTAKRRQEKGRPLLIDQNKQPLVAADGKPYAGCYVNATVDMYVSQAPNVGVRAELVGVQFAKDGDAFGGGAAPSPDDFDEIADSDAGALA